LGWLMAFASLLDDGHCAGSGSDRLRAGHDPYNGAVQLDSSRG
jgi:hypothetical protein